jgi:hypothetical protein
MSKIGTFFLRLIAVLFFNVTVACGASLSCGQEQEVKLVFVTSPDSQYCGQAAQLLNDFSQKGYNIKTISIAQNPDITKQLNITKLPAFILTQNNRIIDRVDGGAAPVVLKPMIQGMFDRADQAARKNITKITHNIDAALTNQSNHDTQSIPASFNTTITTPQNLNQKTPPITATKTSTSPSIETSTPTETSHSIATSTPTPITTSHEIDSLQQKFISSSVKLRVDSANSHSWGSGTIIDTRGNDALILTCGHIFREAAAVLNNNNQNNSNSNNNSNKIIVEVYLYGENSSVKVYGRCIYFDLEIDLALVVIVPPCPVQAIPVASSNLAINAGQNVISVGCDGGANPTIRKHSIMSTNRIGTPTANKLPFYYIQVSGAPVGGRSGGGLFSGGMLIGVCNTADHVRNDGHFVPAEIIRYVLDKQNLSTVYQNPSLKNSKKNNAENITSNTKNVTQNTNQNLNQSTNQNLTQNINQNPSANPNLTPVEHATLSEVKRRVQDGDEVILIVRSRRNPETPSDVIVLNNTSDQFIDTLIQQSPTRYASQNENNNPIILSSHTTQPNSPQPVTFKVPHK